VKWVSNIQIIDTRTAIPGSLRHTVLPVHTRTAIPGSLRHTVLPVHKKSQPSMVGLNGSCAMKNEKDATTHCVLYLSPV